MTSDSPPVELRYWVTVDLIILTLRPAPRPADGPGRLSALTVRRAIEPFPGRWALPGGFVQPDEDLDAAARRKLADETGLSAPGHLEQIATYADVDRDPRGRVITVGFLALAPDLPGPTPGQHTAASRWAPIDQLLGGPDPLAFDHARILADGVERARSKLEYTPLATAFCPPEFTVTELRRVYEAVWGVSLDARNFHRKVTRTPDFLTRTGRTTGRDGGRPAELFQRGTAPLLHPAMLRPATLRPASARADGD